MTASYSSFSGTGLGAHRKGSELPHQARGAGEGRMRIHWLHKKQICCKSKHQHSKCTCHPGLETCPSRPPFSLNAPLQGIGAGTALRRSLGVGTAAMDADGALRRVASQEAGLVLLAAVGVAVAPDVAQPRASAVAKLATSARTGVWDGRLGR
jgi:hypothetical protein